MLTLGVAMSQISEHLKNAAFSQLLHLATSLHKQNTANSVSFLHT